MSGGDGQLSGAAPGVTVAAICFIQADDRVLTVRKRGTSRFMLPGGKLEPGESPEAAACRECAEEIGVTVVPAQLESLGVWQGPAANESGQVITAHVFFSDMEISPDVSREIEEARWIPVQDPGAMRLAPLMEQFVLPRLVARMTARR